MINNVYPVSHLRQQLHTNVLAEYLGKSWRAALDKARVVKQMETEGKAGCFDFLPFQHSATASTL